MNTSPTADYLALTAKAEAMCKKHDASLLFLTLSGSTLYGTQTPGRVSNQEPGQTSDQSGIAIKGIFLPSLQSLALGTAPKSIQTATSGGASRNSDGDVAIELWPVQHWLLKLLATGDTEAMDLFFAPSYAACTLYRHPALEKIFAGSLQLIDPANGRAHAEYRLKQARQYGIKGSRIAVLTTLRNWLRQHYPNPQPDQRLADALEGLAAELESICPDGRFCSIEAVGTIIIDDTRSETEAPTSLPKDDKPGTSKKALQLCGKLHMEGIRISELLLRVEADLQRHGTKVVDAEHQQEQDFAALSEAMRALQQVEELLRTGAISFPLKERAELLAIKEGKIPWPTLETKILNRLESINDLQKKTSFSGVYDAKFARSCVLACYDMEPESGKPAL